jgi:hypothetical protein
LEPRIELWQHHRQPEYQQSDQRLFGALPQELVAINSRLWMKEKF